MSYAGNMLNLTAMIRFSETVVDVKPVPVVALFSMHGPNGLVPEIHMPDLQGNMRHMEFNILSGMLMACPQVSEIKSVRETWGETLVLITHFH
jgi:hypothetical protein